MLFNDTIRTIAAFEENAHSSKEFAALVIVVFHEIRNGWASFHIREWMKRFPLNLTSTEKLNTVGLVVTTTSCSMKRTDQVPKLRRGWRTIKCSISRRLLRSASCQRMMNHEVQLWKEGANNTIRVCWWISSDVTRTSFVFLLNAGHASAQCTGTFLYTCPSTSRLEVLSKR